MRKQKGNLGQTVKGDNSRETIIHVEHG